MSHPSERFSKIRACAWPPRPPPDPSKVRLIDPAELDAWTLHDDDRLLVLNKPGDVVCHPSKAGPWSSLAGAVKVGKHLEKAHLIFRLDRETSGLVLFAKTERLAARLQRALQDRRVRKTYLVLLTGHLPAPLTVDQPLGDDLASPVYVKTCVRPDGKPAVTHFTPLASASGFTLARVDLETGRKHQIRAHARWLNLPVVGDKIYGPDDRLYLDFIDHGYTPALADLLLLPRQALHCATIDLTPADLPDIFHAPFPPDLTAFCQAHALPLTGL